MRTDFLRRLPRAFEHRISLRPRPNERTTGSVKTLPRKWPDNIEAFRIGRWRVDHLDQEMMRKMREIADERRSTVEEVMDRALFDFIERCVADRELETKVIPFPTKRGPNPSKFKCLSLGKRFSDSSRSYRGRSHDGTKRSTGKPNVLRLTRGIKGVA